jgi:hypothetical protein
MTSSSPRTRLPPGPSHPWIKHHESRRRVSSTSNDSPKSLYRRNNTLQPVSAPQLPSSPESPSGTSANTRSFSSGSYHLENEPENTTIIRGAQILRQQFLERSRTQQKANNRLRSEKRVEPTLERLFTSTDEEVLQDLLRTKPLQPPKSPNDVVTGPFLAPEWNREIEASDPWSLRGSAFDPKSTNIMSASSNSRQLSTPNVDPAFCEPTDKGNDGVSVDPAFCEPTDKGNDGVLYVPRQQINDGQAIPERRPQSLRRKPSEALKPLIEQFEPKLTATKAGTGKAVHGWDTASSIRTDMDESTLWANVSVQDTSVRAVSHPTLKEKVAMAVKQTQSAPTIGSDPRASGGGYPSAAQLAAEVHAQVFGSFLDLVSLDDQAIERLIGSKEHDAGRRDTKTKHKEIRDDLLQSSIKRQAMAVERGQAVREARRSVRGRMERSYSGGVAQNSMSKPRSHSVGVDRTTFRRQPGMQSTSLRNDLLCGLESNFKAEQPTRRGRASSVEVVDAWTFPQAETVAKSAMQHPTLLADAWACHETETTKNSATQRQSLMVDPWDCHQTELLRNPAGQHESLRKTKRPHETGKKKEQANVFDLQQQVQRQLDANQERGLPSVSTSMHVLSSDDEFGVLSPESDEYLNLQATDQAFLHAMKAGGLWQSLVGGHVRFPRHWWGGRYRTAPLGCPPQLAGTSKWVYYDRHRVKGNKFLNRCVRKRDEPGQLLLHLIVRDFMTCSPILDIAIGCFHPNAKSVRMTQTSNKRSDDCRDIWMAMRFRTNDLISVIDPVFCSEKMGPPTKTPLGDSKRRISNVNVRAIFGETPPLRTAFAMESDIYEDLASLKGLENTSPADILLQKYVFKR